MKGQTMGNMKIWMFDKIDHSRAFFFFLNRFMNEYFFQSLVSFYLFCYFFGYQSIKFYIYDTLTFAQCFERLFYGQFFF